MLIRLEDIDAMFGIKGLSDDSFFSRYTTVIYDGSIWEIVEFCGSDVIFEEIEFSQERWDTAQDNMSFFYKRSVA